MSNIKKGFTLIELLVVIAIIGILATVVLSSLGSARGSANDAKTKAQISGARAQAEIFASGNNGSYASACTSASGLLAIRDATPGAACFDSSTAWALSGTVTGGFFCADSTGKSATSSAAATTTVCP